MAINPGPIETGDLTAIVNAANALTTNRNGMIDSFQARENSAFRRGLIVDSVIGGFISHLYQVASDKVYFRAVLMNWGGDFPTYASNTASEIIGFFNGLGPADSALHPRAAGR